MSEGVRGRAYLVTGAGRGLGFAIAEALVAAGASVAVNDRTAEATREAVRRLGAAPAVAEAAADLAGEAGAATCVAAALAAFGRLDGVVNNAAINVERPIEETDEAHWDGHLAVDLMAPYFVVQAALPALRAAGGAVVNVASELGLHAIANNVAYVAAKHGLVAMTRALAIELAPAGVRVNALCPGTMDTELMQACAAASGDPASYYAGFASYHPLGRIARPEEIAATVLALLSPLQSFMTGSVVAVDGGSTAGRS